MHTVAENKERIRALYEDCINPGRLDMLDELIAPDFIGPKGELGPREFRASIDTVRMGFPGVRFEIEDLFGEGDKVAVRWTFHARHGGHFAGLPPSGTRVSQAGHVIYQLRDGQIVRAWLQVDRLGVLQQIGAVPKAFAGAEAGRPL
jgi:predicted ester cyclase